MTNLQGKDSPVESSNSDLELMVKETQGLGPPRPSLLNNCGDGDVCQILTYPNPKLRSVNSNVPFDDKLRKLIADMAATMYTMDGIGLAAPQIGVSSRVFIVDILNGHYPKKGPASQLLIAVNPMIWLIPGKTSKESERCLSFPGAVEIIERTNQIILKAFDMDGRPYAFGCTSDLARAIQHEYDHLEGRLIIDHISKLRQRKLKQSIKKSQKYTKATPLKFK